MTTVKVRRGPKTLDAAEKKISLPVYPVKKMVDLIGFYECREIAEKAIAKEYMKRQKEFSKINK